MRKKINKSSVSFGNWRVYDDISGLPTDRKKVHKLGKYTGLDGLWTEMDIKPSYGLAPIKVPKEATVDMTNNLERPLEGFTPITQVDLETEDPMSS